MNAALPLAAVDRMIVLATQAGLPRVARPYHAIADRLGLPPALVMARIAAMSDARAIRRIGAVPNHYRLGYVANGMSVWDVDDATVDAAGARVGALPFVSHCYRRPRRLPAWPYNLFAMVHGRTRDETDARTWNAWRRTRSITCASVNVKARCSTRSSWTRRRSRSLARP